MWPAGDSAFGVRFVELASGLRVRVVERGPVGGPPVLMIPGWGVCAYTFRANLPALASAGYRVMAVDLKGHGLSDKPVGNAGFTLPALVAHVREILDALGLARTAVVAQSMAGRIAIELAIEHPERVSSLSLISPVALGRVRLIRLGRLSAAPIFDPISGIAARRATFRIALRTAYGTLGTVEPWEVDEYWAQAQFPGFVAAARSLLGHFSWGSAPDRVAAVRVPITVFRGTRDRIVAADAGRMAVAAGLDLGVVGGRTTGDRQLLVLEDAGHALNEEAPGAVNASLIAAVGLGR